VRIHDLRRTAGSWIIQSGASLQAVAAVLDHATASSVTSGYARFAESHRREILEGHADKVLELLP
jgi:integrase